MECAGEEVETLNEFIFWYKIVNDKLSVFTFQPIHKRLSQYFFAIHAHPFPVFRIETP